MALIAGLELRPRPHLAAAGRAPDGAVERLHRSVGEIGHRILHGHRGHRERLAHVAARLGLRAGRLRLLAVARALLHRVGAGMRPEVPLHLERVPAALVTRPSGPHNGAMTDPFIVPPLRARVGVVLPPANPVVEEEMRALLPASVRLHAARMPLISGDLQVRARRLSGDARQVLYEFSVTGADGAAVADGRAVVVLNTPMTT